jgi:glycosyltransferase involved in cell wall biosynthesis
MAHRSDATSPIVPDVGVVAVTDDSWNGCWTTRHFILQHLARFFRVAWLEPTRGQWWTSTSRARALKADEWEVNTVKTAGLTGVMKCEPFRWLPDFYKPQSARRVLRYLRYARAAWSLRRLGCTRVVLYVWRPTYVDALEARRWFDAVVYHIDDEYTFSETATPITPTELRLIRESDAVIVHSPQLAERKGGINRRTFVVPNGVDYDLHARRHEPPAAISALPRPRIGYIGVVKKQLDIALLCRLAERSSNWSFVLVGPLGNLSGVEADFQTLTHLPNVHLLGYREPDDLPAYLQAFDVCIMPYKVNHYTDCIYPLKLHEYLASGKPVVASDIRTLRDFSHVISLASGVDGWIAAIQSSLTEEARSDKSVSSRRAIAAQHDWRLLASKTASIIASLLGDEVRNRVPEMQPAMPAAPIEQTVPEAVADRATAVNRS